MYKTAMCVEASREPRMSGTAFTGSFEFPNVGAETQNQVHY